jgi:N4-gp56 family major capsid protein
MANPFDTVNATDTGGLTVASASFYDENFLTMLTPRLSLVQEGTPKPMPANKGTRIYFNRLTQGSATTALTEGTVPAGQTLASTQVYADPVSYGAYWALSDQLNLKAIDPLIKDVSKLCSLQAALSLDTVTRTALLAGSITVAGTVAAAASVTTADVFDSDEIRNAWSVLRAAKCMYFPDKTYHLHAHPYQMNDLRSDSATGGFLDLVKYTSPGKVDEQDPTFNRCKIIEDDNIYNTTDGVGAISVYRALIFSDEGFGRVSISGGENAKILVKQLGSAGASDPLDQVSTVGWKINSYVAKVLDTARIGVIYTAVS